MAEITEKGYALKTQNDYFADERQLYLAIDPNWNLDPSTPDGLKMASDAEIFSAFDETLQQAYNSKDPNKATGVDLRTIGALTGSEPNDGTASSVTLTLSGVAGTFVPAGVRVESVSTGQKWIIQQAATIDSFGTVTTQALCEITGEVQAPPNTLTVIFDTVGGWTGVTNAATATVGTAPESDSSFRIKRATAVGRPGNNQVDSLYGEIYAVKDVRRVKVYENDTGSAAVSTDNPYGLPANSLSIIVDGGIDANVGLAIYIKKNPGIKYNQSGTPVAVDVTSPEYPTNVKNIKFARPLYVDMVINITLKNDGTLPTNVEDLIREAFIEFTMGDLIPAEYGFKLAGFDIGEDVPYSTMFVPINQVIGQYGNSYVQSMTVNGGTALVDIPFNSLSRFTSANITVAVV
jgi:hypothetical protein